MKTDFLYEEWQKLKEDIFYKKNLIAMALMIALMLVFLAYNYNLYFKESLLSFIILSFFLYLLFCIQEDRKHKFIKKNYFKSLKDYRYQVGMIFLSDSEDLFPYAVRVRGKSNKDQDRVMPAEMFFDSSNDIEF